jgi:secreted PhoX family phosphatase
MYFGALIMFMRRPLALAISALMLGSVTLLTGCNESITLTPTAISFSETPAPTTADKMAVTHTSSIATVTFNDGSTKDYPLSYNKLFGVKDKVGTNPYPAGQVFNSQMQPVNDASGKPAVIETPDSNSLLNIDGKLYLVTHYEYDWIDGNGSETTSRMPMSMTLTHVAQDATTGKLTATNQTPVNFSNVGGLWIPCAGSQTPWNTHLGSEEDYDLQYNPNSSSYAATLSGVQVMRDVYGNVNSAPYQYGYLTEVVVGANGATTPIKHYGMGRGTWEMGKVMPDGKTVYFGDDGTNVALFMFVGNTVNDLSKGGTLYAAKWTQTSAAGSDGGTANLTWVKLGSSTSDAQIKALADTNTFESIFNNGTFSSGTCSTGTWVRAGSTNDECISIKSGQETAAAFLESRRVAALKGATTEFNKMEGVAINAKDKKLYLAMSYIDKGMLASTSSPTDHIQLVKNNAGATYTLDLIGSVKDTEGNNINSDFVAKNMYVETALLGKVIATDSLGNTADPAKIANTDNIFFAEKMRTLFIGEDSGTHVNNFVWAYNVDSKKLTRILSAVSGAENTGLQIVEDMNGHAYIMSNSQHHGDFISTHNAASKTTLTPMIDKFDANVGYIGGLPALK